MALIEKIFGKKSNELLIPLENYQCNKFKEVFSPQVKKFLKDGEITIDELYTSLGKYLDNMSKITYNLIKEYDYITDSDINKKIPVMWPQFVEYGISSGIIKDEEIEKLYSSGKSKFSKEIPKKEDLINKELSQLLC